MKVILWAAGVVFAVLVALAVHWAFSPGGALGAPSREEFPVRGLDISAHNGVPDFGRIAADSIDFVIMKATEGADFLDAAFGRNYAEARKAGLRVGAYHFFRFDTPGYMQALNLLHAVRGRHLDLPLAIDVEEWTNPDDRSTQVVVAELRRMLEVLEGEGYPVMLYSNKDGYRRFLRGRFDDYPLWIASVTSTPEREVPQWTLWQYTHHGSAHGVDGNVDVNTFSGSRAQWEAWLMENSPARQ